MSTYALIAQNKKTNTTSIEDLCIELQEAITVGETFWSEQTDENGKCEWFRLYVIKAPINELSLITVIEPSWYVMEIENRGLFKNLLQHYQKYRDIEYFKKHFKGYFSNSYLADSHYHLSMLYRLEDDDLWPLYSYMSSILVREWDNVYIRDGHTIIQ